LTSVQALFDALPQRDKELAVLENSYHMVTIDNDRHEVAALLERFVKRVTASRAPSPPVTGQAFAEANKPALPVGADPTFQAT
jgi:hypothetical protein